MKINRITPFQSVVWNNNTDRWQALAMQIDRPHQASGRIFNRDEIQNVIDRFHDRDEALYGEFGAAILPERDDLKLRLNRVSHEVVGLDLYTRVVHEPDEERGAYTMLLVTIRTIPSGAGIELARLLNSGVELYPFVRGSGDVVVDKNRDPNSPEQSERYLVRNYKLFTVDIDLHQNLFGSV